MKQKEEKLERLEQTLKEAHRSPDEVDLSPAWRYNLMQRVSRLGAPEPEAGAAPYLERLLWPAAGVASLAAIALVVFVVFSGDGPDTLVLELFTGDPLGLLGTPPFG